MIEVLLTKNTCSMAIVGTSAIRMRLKALDMAGSMPSMSNSISSLFVLCTMIRKFSAQARKSQALSICSALYMSFCVTVSVCRDRTGHLLRQSI